MNSGSSKRVQNSIIKASFTANIIMSVLTEIGPLSLLKTSLSGGILFRILYGVEVFC